jgi:eukaryotic-like serine/threonine-protein kinase
VDADLESSDAIQIVVPRTPVACVPLTDETTSWELQEGDEIVPGRSVVRDIGGGRRFEVMLVWDQRMFALTVAKVLRPAYAESERALRELAEEADILERLRHPVIVRSFDAVFEGRYPHVLLEHLEGPSLRSLIRRHGALPLEQVLPLSAHVAAALHYMAEMRVLHLDVKPDNIIMGVPPRLVDLSIATALQDAAAITHALGTDAYMPPEQCLPKDHQGEIGPASDVWGLGATLHHALSGREPFPRVRGTGASEDPVARWPQLEHAPQPLPKQVPPPLRELIAATLALDPADRPSAGDVALALEPLVAELPRKLAFARFGMRAR